LASSSKNLENLALSHFPLPGSMANGAYAQYVCASSIRPEIGQTATWLLISGTKSNQPARIDRFYERCASYEAAFFTCV